MSCDGQNVYFGSGLPSASAHPRTPSVREATARCLEAPKPLAERTDVGPSGCVTNDDVMSVETDKKCTACNKRERVTNFLCEKCATKGVTCSRDGCNSPAIGETSQYSFDNWCAFHRAQSDAEVKAKVSAEKAKPWFIGAAIVAGFGLAAVLFGNTSYRSSSSGRRIDCGTIFSPTFPRDGRGPCTDILASQQNQLIFFLVVAAAVAVVGFVKRSG